jgi:hypothetical protein
MLNTGHYGAQGKLDTFHVQSHFRKRGQQAVPFFPVLLH